MNLAILTLHDLIDYPLADWIDLSKHTVHVFADEESQSTDNRHLAGCKSVRCYGNYTNNGLVDRDVLAIPKLDRVIGFGEDDVIRAARIRERLGLPGQSLESALAFRDKATMKDYLSRAGVPVARYRRVTSPLDVLDLVEEVGLPIFVKPLSSSGSAEARAIRTEAELETFLATGLKARLPFAEYVPDLIVEEFVEAELYHVDGFVLSNQPLVMVPSKYLSSSLVLDRIDAALASYTLDPADPLATALEAFVGRALAALPSPESFPFHAEVFVDAAGDFRLCEVASRTGGARVNRTVKIATGLDLNQLQLLSAVDPPRLAEVLAAPDSSFTPAGWSMVCPAGVRVVRAPEAPGFEWLEEFRSYASVGDVSTMRQFSGDKIASAVVRGRTADDVKEKLGEFNRWFLQSFTERVAP